MEITTQVIQDAFNGLFQMSKEELNATFPTPVVEFIVRNMGNEKFSNGLFMGKVEDFEFYYATRDKIQNAINSRDGQTPQTNDLVYFIDNLYGGLKKAALKGTHTSHDPDEMSLISYVAWAWVNADDSVSFEHSGLSHYTPKAELKSLGQSTTRVQYPDRYGFRAHCAYYADVQINTWVHPNVDIEQLAQHELTIFKNYEDLNFSEKCPVEQPLASDTFYQFMAEFGSEFNGGDDYQLGRMGSRFETLFELMTLIKSVKNESKQLVA